MNAWDVVTWLSAVALAASAVVIFWFFLRDARSILNREMHGHDDEDAEDSSASGATPGTPPSSPPEDRPR
ncbi:MAG: hypothetical protein JRG80_03565 [Deltaproteobacteria bacterium]|nr:hypothetical protein [Deltaproteobacteria bacterium]MBW2398334.1 hypothetical protein [Deltaproteobacteria bacterium]